ncbi:MAG: helix-turn-helix transcriptional regulator [Fluviicola sp.]
MRSKVELTEEEGKVLELIIRQKTSQQISTLTNIPLGTINGYRRRLRNKFGAKSNVHLIVLAVLEHRFYKLIGANKFKRQKITNRDRNILFLFLKGLSGQEIAAELRISERAVEYARQKFMLDNQNQGDVGFVKACIECGVLVILPVRFHFKEYFMLGEYINVYKLRKSDVRITIETNTINSTGFLYLDFENRFWFECTGDYKKEKKIVDSVATSLFLSGLSEKYIVDLLKSETVNIEESVENVRHDVDLISHEEFVEFYKTREQFKPIIDPAIVSNVLTAGQVILVELIAKRVPEREIYERMKSRKKYVDEHIKIILEMWSSMTILGVYTTFIHLNFLPRKKM